MRFFQSFCARQCVLSLVAELQTKDLGGCLNKPLYSDSDNRPSEYREQDKVPDAAKSINYKFVSAANR